MKPTVPAYFDFLLEDFRRGRMLRHVHLGHWEGGEVSAEPGEFGRAQQRLCEVLLEMARLEPGQRVLDVGCGFGGTLEAINASQQAMELVGVNIDPRQLTVCAGLAPLHGNRFQWVEADACQLPMAAASFERVLCVEAMFHFASRRVFFGEVARVLAPGGIFVASDIVLNAEAAQLAIPGFCVEAALCDGYGPWPDVWGADADHRRLAAAAGLECRAMIDASRWTRRSYRYTVPPHLDGRRDPVDVGLRAGLMLKRLHEGGLLQYVYMAFQKPG